jgi:hypothetical protein
MNPSIRDATVVWRRALRALVEQTGGMIALDIIQGDGSGRANEKQATNSAL